MKKSPVKKTQDKSRSPSRSKISPVAVKTQVLNSLYYCHYKNATYMGGIKAFKKEGRGILLHDDGISAITSYCNDLLHGHNIFLDNYGLLSAVFTKNKLTEAVYRTQGFLVTLNYNSQGQLEGQSILLNYVTKNIIYATFRRGNMSQKTQQNDLAVLSRVFQLGQLDFLIGITHSKVIRYEFPKVPLVQTQKQGNRIIVGFEKAGFINGLGFMFVVRGSQGGLNPDTLRNEDEFQLRLVERGYYINTQLCGMGEKTFKNGNVYVGEFKNNIFEGNGILKNSEKRNWVSGFFENGNLVELLEYNSESDDMKYKKVIEALHERRTNWINYQVSIPSFNTFVDQIQKIIKNAPNRHMKSLQQRKQQVLKRIQQKFISDTNNSFQNQLSNDSLNQIKKSDPGSSSIKRFINNFTPNQTSSRKRQQTSRNINNQNEPMSFQASSPVKRQEDKQKIFTRTSRSPVTAKKQRELRSSRDDIQRSPGYISQTSSSQVRAKPYLHEDRYEQRNSPSLRKANTSAHLGILLSSERESLHNRDNLDSKRMVSKNKIFRYLQNQNLQSSPKFTYTPVDS